MWLSVLRCHFTWEGSVVLRSKVWRRLLPIRPLDGVTAPLRLRSLRGIVVKRDGEVRPSVRGRPAPFLAPVSQILQHGFASPLHVTLRQHFNPFNSRTRTGRASLTVLQRRLVGSGVNGQRSDGKASSFSDWGLPGLLLPPVLYGGLAPQWALPFTCFSPREGSDVPTTNPDFLNSWNVGERWEISS